MKKYIWVETEGDNADGIFEVDTGELVCVLDKYHGEQGHDIKKFCNIIGVPFEHIYEETLLGRELTYQEREVDATDEIPCLELFSQAIRDMA